MNIEQLIAIVRNDYLDDAVADFLWSDAFMFRSFTEAERQVCNRQNVLFDDSTTAYTKISLLDGVGTYDLDQKVNKLEQVLFNDTAIGQVSKHEIERLSPAWRSFTGMVNKVINYIIRGRTIRFTPSPNALYDATFIQESAPTTGMVNDDTWFNTTSNLLYIYSGTWDLDANAVLGTVTLEVFRMPVNDLTAITDIPEIPEEFHRDLIYWVLHEAYKKQDSDAFNQERSDYFLARFQEIFGEYIPLEVRMNSMQQRSSMHLRPTAYTTKLTRTTSSDDWD